MALHDVLVRVDADVSSYTKNLVKAQGRLQSFGRITAAASTAVAGAFASMSLATAAAMEASVQKASEFEDAFTGVRKTVDASEAGYKRLAKGILDMSRVMPQSAAEIALVAEKAGQLGIKEKDILKFTKTMIMMGDATNISSDQAAISLARFMSIMGTSTSKVDRLGSAITHLGNNTATSEAEIVQMGLRLAGAGRQIKMSESDVIAFAASLSELGIRAEAGGTAMSRVFLDMNTAVMQGGKKLNKFAEVAGMTGSEFKKAFEKDSADAIATFIEGLSKMSKEGKDVASVIDELGFGNVRTRDALLRLSGAHEKLRENLGMSKKAWKENRALVEEAEKRYATFSSKLKMLRNRLNRVLIIIGTPLMTVLSGMIDAINPVINAIEKLADWFHDLDESTQKTIATVALAVSGLFALGAAFFTALSGVGFLVMGLDALAAGFGISVGALLLFIGKIALIGTAVAGAIAGLVALTVAVVKNWDRIKQATKRMVISVLDAFSQYRDILTDSSLTTSEKLGEMAKLTKTRLQAVAITVKEYAKQIREKLLDLIPAPVLNAINAGVDAIKSGFKKLEDAGYPIQDIMKNLSGIFVALGLSLLGVSGPVGILIGSLVFLTTKTNILTDLIKVFKGEMTFGEAIGNMTDMVNKFVEGFGDMALAAIEAGGKIIGNLLEGLSEALPKIAEAISAVVNKIIEIFGEMLPQLIQVGAQIIEQIIIGIGEFLPQIIGVGLEIIMTLIGAIVDALPLILDAALTIIETLVTGIIEVLPTLIEVGTQILLTLVNAITELLPQLIDVGVTILTTLIEGIISILPTLIETGIKLIVALVGALILALPKLIDVGIQLIKALIDGIITALPGLIDAGANLVVKLGEAIGKMLPRIVDAGIELLNALIEGIISVLPQLLAAGAKLIGKLLVAILKFIPQLLAAGVKLILSLVSGVLNTVGQLMAAGGDLMIKLLSKLGSFAGQMLTKGMSLVGQLVQGALAKVGAIGSAAVTLMNKFISKVSEQGKKAMNAAKGVGKKVVDGAKSVWDAMKGAGKNLVDGLISGISNMGESAINAITGVVGGVVKKAKSMLKIKSPSRVFMQIGEYTGEGLVIGMDGQIRDVAYMASKLADAAVPETPKLGKFEVGDMRRQAQTISTRFKTEADEFNVEKDEELTVLGEIRDELRKQKQMIVELNGREIGKAIEPEVTKRQKRNKFTKSKGWRGEYA